LLVKQLLKDLTNDLGFRIVDKQIAGVHSKKSILRMKTAFIDCAEANFLFVVAICIALS